MSYDVDEKSEHGDGAAFINRGKKNTTIRAVKNVWHERACAHARHYKRFYIAFSVVLVLAVAATALAPRMIQMHRQHGQSGGTKNQDSPSLVPIASIPILTVSTSSPLSSTTSTTSAAATASTTTTAATTTTRMPSSMPVSPYLTRRAFVWTEP